MSSIPDGTILVLSKGRAGRVTTTRWLDRDGVEHYVVVEPHERDAYAKAGHKRLIVLPESHRGLDYARNWVLDHAEKRVVMMDDDVGYFGGFSHQKGNFYYYTARNGVRRAALAHLLDLAEEHAFCGLAHKMAANSGSRRIMSVHGLNVRRIGGLRYRPLLSEDLDFQLQNLVAGNPVAISAHYAWDYAKTCGAHEGGLMPIRRDAARALESLNRFCALWKHTDIHLKGGVMKWSPIVKWQKYPPVKFIAP